MSEAKPEFSRPIRVETVGSAPRRVGIEAGPEERAALARRFGLLEIELLTADVEVARTGEVVSASGRLRARVTQSCVASGAPVEAVIEEPFDILFQPAPETGADEEIELSERDCDVVFYAGGAIDIGEAVAESLSLALDPWPRSPDAEAALRAAGIKSEEEAGPFAALAGLRDKLGG